MDQTYIEVSDIGIIDRLVASLSYRSGPLCEYVCAKLRFARLMPKGIGDWTYVTLTGRRHLLMLEHSLWSLFHAAEEIPQIIIITDGSLNYEEVTTRFRWWPGLLTVRDYRYYADHYRNKGINPLAEFADKHPMGRKMAGLIYEAEKALVFYADVDVLWFRNPVQLVVSRKTKRPFSITMCPDQWMSYDQTLIAKADLQTLLKAPFLNAGVIALEGDLLKETNLLDMIKIALEQYNFFSEQTMFAAIAAKSDVPSWSQNEIACNDFGKVSLMPTFLKKQWLARHYITPVRHLFWRDALALRLGF